MNEKPNYFAILTADVRYADIPAGAKLLYAEITALQQKEGYCYASNNYFAGLFSCSDRTIKNWIKLLTKYKFIHTEINQKEGNLRKIYLVKKTSLPSENNFPTPSENNFPTLNNINNNNIGEQNPPISPKGNDVSGETQTDQKIQTLCQEFKKHRAELHLQNKSKYKPMTDTAVKNFAKKLERLRAKGWDIDELVEDAIATGWQTVYEPKGKPPEKGERSASRNKNIAELTPEQLYAEYH